MNNGFREGYEFFTKNTGVNSGSVASAAFVDSVQKEIDNLIDNMNQFQGFDTAASQLKGDIAEYWHSGTFNIDALVKGSSSRTFVERSHDFGSADISTNWGDKVGLKYYSNATESSKQQAKSIFERFKEYQSNNGKDSLEEYLSKRGYSSKDVINDPIYKGQVRIIPKDQLEESASWLKRKIIKENEARPEQVNRYKDTLEHLSDRISDGKGSESTPLSKADAERIARHAKESDVNADELGLTTQELIQLKDVLAQAFKAGLTAGTITCALKVAPEILCALKYLVQNGKIDESSFKKIGVAAVNGFGEGFIKGTIAATLTACCESGLLGDMASGISPSLIGTCTVIAYDTIVNAYEVVRGNKTRYELTNSLIKEMYISAWSIGLGTVSQSIMGIPVLGFMLGSFIGSTIGAFTYSVSDTLVMSFCVETGFTMFGLVDQNYELPDEILKEIGVEVFEYENIDYEAFEYEKFEYDAFSVDQFIPDSIDITLLRRGVIGVAKIGYLL